jgi:hypothetical protein
MYGIDYWPGDCYHNIMNFRSLMVRMEPLGSSIAAWRTSDVFLWGFRAASIPIIFVNIRRVRKLDAAGGGFGAGLLMSKHAMVCLFCLLPWIYPLARWISEALGTWFAESIFFGSNREITSDPTEVIETYTPWLDKAVPVALYTILLLAVFGLAWGSPVLPWCLNLDGSALISAPCLRLSALMASALIWIIYLILFIPRFIRKLAD